MPIPTRRGSVRVTLALATAALGFWLASALGLTTPWNAPGVAEPDVATSVRYHAELRSTLERLTVVLQVLAVGTLCLSRFQRPCPGTEAARRVFVGAMVGLGGVGVGCAGYASPFALFAGGTMALLLNVVIMGQQPRALAGGYLAV